MKQFILKNKWFFIIALCGFIAASAAIIGRIAVESNNKTYDIVVDYAELGLMAEQSDESLDWWLNKFVQMGITKVGLMEETLDSLRQEANIPVEADLAENITKNIDWQAEYPGAFVQQMTDAGLDRYDVIVTVKGMEYYKFVTDAFLNRYDHKKFIVYPADGTGGITEGGYLWIDGTVGETLYSLTEKEITTKNKGFREYNEFLSSKILNLSLGLMDSKVDQIQNAGMMVIPRTTSYNDWNDYHYAEEVTADYGKLNQVPDYMIVAGDAVIGYDDGIKKAVEYLKKSGTSIATIENTTQLQNITQDGVEETIEATEYNVVRVFTVWNYIQYRYQYYGYEDSKEIENTLFRAVSERNIRVVYFKPIKDFEDNKVYITDPDEYEKMFTNLNNRLDRHGISMGRASVMDPYTTSNILKIIIGIGSVAAAILLLCGFLPLGRKIKWILMILGAIGVVGAFFVAPNVSKLLLSFASAVVFPCLATILVVAKCREDSQRLDKNTTVSKIIGPACVTLILGIAVSLIGGIVTGASLSEISFMLEIDIYRGVKVAQILPLVFFPVAYLAYFGFGDKKKKDGQLEFHDLVEMLNLNIKVWMVIVGVIFAGIGAYYIIRTGHTTNITPSTIEMLFRNALEDLLIARPRNKEFLFAFPSLMLFVYCGVRRMKLFSAMFGICSVIGLTSVVNTFMHIRTPLYLGFVRTGFSSLFGLIIGVVGILVFEGLLRLCRKCRAAFESQKEG